MITALPTSRTARGVGSALRDVAARRPTLVLTMRAGVLPQSLLIICSLTKKGVYATEEWNDKALREELE